MYRKNNFERNCTFLFTIAKAKIVSILIFFSLCFLIISFQVFKIKMNTLIKIIFSLPVNKYFSKIIIIVIKFVSIKQYFLRECKIIIMSILL